MPYGVYKAGVAGDEVSSTYEGRHLTFSESQILHPDHPDDFVDEGDPCVVGDNIIGVAFGSATAETDLIAIDTEGIWQLAVQAKDDDGDSAIVVGDELFINTSTCIISKISNVVTQQVFGYALYPIASGETGVIPVKVHLDPTVLTDQDFFAVFESGHGADNARTIKVTDNDINDGGMSRGLAIDYTTTAAKTGTAQVNGLAIDMAIGAACPDVMPLTIYLATIADKIIGNLFPLSMYFEDFGNAVTNFCALDIGYNSPHAPSGRNAFMRLRQHHTVQAGSAVMLLEGNSAAALLIQADTVANLIESGDVTNGKACTHGVRCKVGATVFVLAGYAD